MEYNDPVAEVIECGFPPYGGERSEITYLDDRGNVVPKSMATQSRIHVIDADGKMVASILFVFEK